MNFHVDEDFKRHLQHAHWFHVAAATAVFWDHASSFDLEVELIWKKKISAVQILYILTRYIGDAVFLHSLAVQYWVKSVPTFNALCTTYATIQYWLVGITILSMQSIMVHRVHCMYQERRAILVSLLSGLGAMALGSVIVAVMFTAQVATGPVIAGPDLKACLPRSPAPNWSTAPWFISMVFDSAIVFLSVREGLRYMRESQTARDKAKHPISMKNWSSQGLLFRVLIRDSIAIPFLGTMVCVGNVLAWYAIPLTSGALVYTIGTGSAMTPILGCRLVLNLRDAYYKPFATEFEQNELDLRFSSEASDLEEPSSEAGIGLDDLSAPHVLRRRSYSFK